MRGRAIGRVVRDGLSRASRRFSSSQPAYPYLKPAADPSRLTLCLDLDECLVYCTVAEGSNASFMESHGAEMARESAAYDARHRRQGARLLPPHDFELELPYLEDPVQLRKRPNLDDFLLEASKMCELVLFTSAAKTYAEECVSVLDPERSLFSDVLSRQHCVLMRG